MPIVVSDTSVIVDLERGSLLEAAFGLELELAVPDLLYERELKAYGGPRLIEFGLRVENLTDEAVTRALGYRTEESVLSLPDAFALSLAKHHQWALLSGDGPLRELAAREAVECHGVLWVLDRILEANKAAARLLNDGLTAIAGHPRCRLPQKEIRQRLEQYNGLCGS